MNAYFAFVVGNPTILSDITRAQGLQRYAEYMNGRYVRCPLILYITAFRNSARVQIDLVARCAKLWALALLSGLTTPFPIVTRSSNPS